MPDIPAPQPSERRNVERRQVARWAVVVPASVLLGWMLAHFGVPAAWILGGIVASGAMALSTGQELHIHPGVFRLSRGFIGILAALPLVHSDPATLSRYLVPGLVVSVATVAIGFIGGVLLARFSRHISAETGVLSMLAGGASMMPVLAKEMGADYRYVALTQYLRLLAVSISLPLITHIFAPPPSSGAFGGQDAQVIWWAVLLLVAIAWFGPTVGKLLHIPVAPVFGPMLLVVLCSLVLPDPDVLVPPQPLQIFAFQCIGWLCGGALSMPALKTFARQLPATIMFIVVLIGGCALLAWPLVGWLDISYFEAYLATTPGALETVLALASEGGAGPVVVAIQIVRIMCILATASYLPSILRRLRRLEHRKRARGQDDAEGSAEE